MFCFVFLLNIFITTDGDADACWNITINSKYIFEYEFATYELFDGFYYHEFDFLCMCHWYCKNSAPSLLRSKPAIHLDIDLTLDMGWGLRMCGIWERVDWHF